MWSIQPLLRYIVITPYYNDISLIVKGGIWAAEKREGKHIVLRLMNVKGTGGEGAYACNLPVPRGPVCGSCKTSASDVRGCFPASVACMLAHLAGLLFAATREVSHPGSNGPG